MSCNKCGSKSTRHMPGCEAGNPKKNKMTEFWSRNAPIKDQLEGFPCKRHEITIKTNRKGKQFKECSKCGEYLGDA